MKALEVVFPAAFMILILPAFGQTPTSPCTSSMLTSFTPCMNYLTNGTGSGTSPTSACCTSLRSLMTNGTDCLCQIVMGGVPLRIPFNRTLAFSLPRACNQARVPLQCKASPGAPVPASGPAAFGPSATPSAAVSPSPLATTDPTSTTPALAPVSNTSPNLTPSTIEGFVPPTPTTPGTSSSLTPSSAMPSFTLSPFVLFSMAIIIVNYF